MFTGLIEEVGTIQGLEQSGNTMILSIACEKVLDGTIIGDSIAVNGICLTVTTMGNRSFTADVMPETVKRTHLHTLRAGARVNLERALALGERLGGHMVQGHVDGVAELVERRPLENAELFRFRSQEELTSYMIEKGSIAINGVSLTLINVGQNHFSVSLIPHSLENTQFQHLRPGDQVNIETDLIGKYIAKLMPTDSQNNQAASELSKEQIQKAGFFA